MKILQLLEFATKHDWHWMLKFLKSPYFNQNEDILTLFEQIKKAKNATENTIFSKNKEIDIPLGDQINRVAFHHNCHYLLQSIEAYFAWDEFRQNELEQDRHVLQAYRKRGVDKFYQEKLQKLRHKSVDQPLRHADFYRFEYQLALEDYQHSIKTGRSTAEQLQPLMDLHDQSYIAEKLKNACGTLSRQRVAHTDLDTGMLPWVLDYIDKRPALLSHTAIAVYYYGYMALSEPTQDAHFGQLKRRLPAATQEFPMGELRDVYLLAINFCIHRINLREESYLTEIFELYKNGLASGVFLDNGQISRFTYTNIALAGLRLQAFQWVYQFLQQYRELLPESQRQGAYSFNLARFYCESGDYEQAMPLLLEMDFDDVLHNLTAKAMLVKMYFETGESSALISLLSSLGAYLRRKRQISEQQKTAYLNFIRFVKKLHRRPFSKRKKTVSYKNAEKSAREQLKTDIQHTPLVAEKDWLLRMVGE
jgi:hypothetical protein